MIFTSFKTRCARPVQQNITVSLSEQLNQDMIVSAPSTETAVFAQLDYECPDTLVFDWNILFLDELFGTSALKAFQVFC